jgi:uncharacterized protein (DUF1501 family)
VNYASSVQYGNDDVAQYMRNIVQTHLAHLGTRVLYTTAPYNSFDTHAGQMANHTRLWTQTSKAISAFYDDLKEHNATDNVVLFVFSEFGRRVHDNGSGTDHGAGGIAFVIGDAVKGGLYGEYPSLQAGKLLEGDLHFNNDFRGTYATLLERWLGLDARSIVGGSFEQIDFL